MHDLANIDFWMGHWKIPQSKAFLRKKYIAFLLKKVIFKERLKALF